MRGAYIEPVKADPESFLPLRDVEYHVLVALADQERHGYAILQETAERTGGALRLEPGTLYRALRRMVADGLVAESSRRRDPAADDERRRYYRVTALGRQVALLETERLEALVRAARRTRLLGPQR
jgi:DNA-binding PadR family transcriptional regulator